MKNSNNKSSPHVFDMKMDFFAYDMDTVSKIYIIPYSPQDEADGVHSFKLGRDLM